MIVPKVTGKAWMQFTQTISASQSKLNRNKFLSVISFTALAMLL